MDIDVSAVTSHFPNPQDGFTTTTSGSVSSGASTVGLNSTGNYDNGDIVVLIIDPADANKKQVLVGTIDVGGSQVTNVVWVGGTNQAHSSGATVVDYYDAAHIKMITKGLLVSHNQDGTLKNGAVSSSGMFAAGVVDSSAIGPGAVGNTQLITGAPVQVAGTPYSDVATGTTVMPLDDSVPQNTEGDEYMTQSFTPKSATNKLLIEVSFFGALSVGTNDLVMALFQDSTANAIAATSKSSAGNNFRLNLTLRHVMTAGTTSAITFKLRAGPASAATLTFNGHNGNRDFGAITKSSIVITEYKA